MSRKLKGSASRFGAVLLAMGVLGGCAAESSGGSGSDDGATAASAPAATAAPRAGMTATAAVTLVPPAPELSEVDVNLDQLQWMIR